MSFSSDAKEELCALPVLKADRDALAYGMLLFARSFSLKGISLTTENRAVSQLLAELITSCGCIADVTVALSRKKAGGAITVSVPDGNDRLRLLERFGYSGREVNLRIHYQNFSEDASAAAFLRGAFLSCGAVTDPSKDYHMEFSVPYMKLAGDLAAFLRGLPELQMEPGVTNRKGAYVVYLKGSEQITDLLTYIGAHRASMELMQVKMVKEVRNYVNRTTNFETANISKTASAAALQLEAIRKIQKTSGLESLPEELKEIAVLRLENPELSLRELGARLSEPISRSGVNHRLKRLLAIAEKQAPDSDYGKER